MTNGGFLGRALFAATKPHWNAILLVVPLVVLMLLLYAWPMVRVLLLSLNWPDVTFAQYERIALVPAYSMVLLNTLKIATLVTISCLVLGYPIAFLMANVSATVVRWLVPFVIVPFATSLLVRNYAWMVLLGNNGLVNNLLAYLGLIEEPLPLLYNVAGATVGMTHILLPYMVLSLFAAMRGIDRSLVVAAQGLGANALRTFASVYLPLSVPGITAGCLLVFIMSLGFFITPALLGGRSGIMISMVIETQINQLLNWPLGSALAVTLLAATLALLAAYTWVFRSKPRIQSL